ncbi:hypothetical protein WN66_03037 [Saccharomyces cerevisiae]|nr:hypothetical protein WN66_03037 [Saccharomyces cerevisiae]
MNMKMLLTRIHEMNALISSELNGRVDFFKNHRMFILSLVKILLVCTSRESLSVMYFRFDSFFDFLSGGASLPVLDSLEYALSDAAAIDGILKLLRRAGLLAQYTYLATEKCRGLLRKGLVKRDI